ncbi:MAG: hypothetical protein U9Q03_04125 [Patescibacteria group bacterium]|nr:hypothetical protein [Patescibacteria group bacterium]
MSIEMIVPCVLAGILFVALAYSIHVLTDRRRRRRGVCETVQGLAFRSDQARQSIRGLGLTDPNMLFASPVHAWLLAPLLIKTGGVMRRLRSLSDDIADMPIDVAENEVVRLFPVVNRLENLLHDIKLFDVTAHNLREQMSNLLESMEEYRGTLLRRIDRLREKGHGFGRERCMVISFWNLFRMHLDNLDRWHLDGLHGLAGVLMIMNSIDSRLKTAERGGRIRWRSYRKDRRALKLDSGFSRVGNRLTGELNLDMACFISAITLEVGKISRHTTQIAQCSASTHIVDVALMSSIRRLCGRAAHLRIRIRQFGALP